MQNREEINDLTIYDYGLNVDQHSKLSMVKWFYTFFLVIHIVLTVFGGISSLIYLNLLGLASLIVDIVGFVFSIGYCLYPKSNIAHLKPWTNIFLVVYSALKVIYFILMLVILLSLNKNDIPGWDSRYDDYYTAFIVIVIIVSLVPLLHVLGILFFWRARWGIANSLKQTGYQQLGNNPGVYPGMHQQNPNQYYQYQNEPGRPGQDQIYNAYPTTNQP